jgi:hypothetical protein
MTARSFTIMTYGGLVLGALFVLVVVLLGGNWSGGNEGMEWFLFATSAMVLGMYFVYQRKLSLAKMGARYLLAVERELTMEDALEICRKYSFLLLISAGLFLVAGVAAIFVY